jgi:hypothetical protein
MIQPLLIPEIEIEDLDPKDLVSAAKTSSQNLRRTICHLQPLGAGFEAFLRWSLNDISAARQSPIADTQSRFCVNALMNARRALSCLVDQYLARDGFAFCSDAPSEAGDKVKLLVRRNVIDHLAAGALKRAIELRHQVEHRYEVPQLEDAENMVQIVRATIETAAAKSDPYSSRSLFGTILGGYSSGQSGEKHWFGGWNGLLFVVVVISSKPWAGVLIPSSNTKATLRKAVLKKVSCDQLFDFLAVLEGLQESGYSGLSPGQLEGQLTCAGLW